MKVQTFFELNNVLALDRKNIALGATKCKVCGESAFIFDIVDFNKVCSPEYYPYGFTGIPVTYYRCQNCAFIFTDFFDDWTREDFANFIYNSDYPMVDGSYASARPQRTAADMAGFLQDHRSARILDYGSGSGAFAERLKAEGFAEVHSYDPVSSPSRPAGRFDIITCFETIEHSPFPNDTMADIVSFMEPDGCVIFGTSVQPPNINELRANWWYIAPRNGHVSIYTVMALQLSAATVGLELYSGRGKLVFAGRSPSPRLMPLLGAIVPRRVFARLAAPADQPPPPPQPAALAAPPGMDWHPIEGSGPIRFRWTRTGRVEWRLENQPRNYPCRLALTIPFVMEIIPGYAERCLLQIGGRDYPVHVEAGAITVEVELDEPIRQPIALVMPEPQRPSDLRDTADRRTLGLAIPLAVEFG